MEKIKWLIIAFLVVIIAIVIFFNSGAEENETLKNYTEFEITYSDIVTREGKPLILKEGTYQLFLEEFQIVEGKGRGWHLRFSAPDQDREMILEFDVVDTSGTILTDNYPQVFNFTGYEDSLTDDQPKLYRGSVFIGYTKRISENLLQEDVIPMLNFHCRIDTAWVNDTLGGFVMSYKATHSDVLADVYGMRYQIQGTMNVDSARITNRILQQQ